MTAFRSFEPPGSRTGGKDAGYHGYAARAGELIESLQKIAALLNPVFGGPDSRFFRVAVYLELGTPAAAVGKCCGLILRFVPYEEDPDWSEDDCSILKIAASLPV